MHYERSEVPHVPLGLAVALLELEHVLTNLLDDEQRARHQVSLVHLANHVVFLWVQD